ncbi:MAG TPA: hypothetical protein VLA90_02405 [Actinomycetota bacterium]|nr:hypothetical protein [Actinomycetota bacterium]
MSERRRFTAIVLLFLIGFGLVGFSSVVGSVWPLLLSPIPYAAIPWIVVRSDDAEPVPAEAEA